MTEKNAEAFALATELAPSMNHWRYNTTTIFHQRESGSIHTATPSKTEMQNFINLLEMIDSAAHAPAQKELLKHSITFWCFGMWED